MATWLRDVTPAWPPESSHRLGGASDHSPSRHQGQVLRRVATVSVGRRLVSTRCLLGGRDPGNAQLQGAHHTDSCGAQKGSKRAAPRLAVVPNAPSPKRQERVCGDTGGRPAGHPHTSGPHADFGRLQRCSFAACGCVAQCTLQCVWQTSSSSMACWPWNGARPLMWLSCWFVLSSLARSWYNNVVGKETAHMRALSP